jgi:hypothetical protein
MIVDRHGNECWNLKVTGKVITYQTEEQDKQSLGKTEFSRNHYFDGDRETTSTEDYKILRQLNLASYDPKTAGLTMDQRREIAEQSSPELAQAATTTQDPTTITITDTYSLVSAIANQFYDDGEMPIKDINITQTTKWHSDIQGNELVLTIPARSLNLPINDFAVRLAHEFAHARNLFVGCKDTCGGGSYHNDNFKNEAEDLFLTAVKTRGQGWGNTEPTPKFLAKIGNLPLDTAASVLSQLTMSDNDLAAYQSALLSVDVDKMQRVREAKTTTQTELAALRDEVAQLKELVKELNMSLKTHLQP